MNAKLQVDNFYRNKYQWCVDAVLKGKRGDGVTIQYNDALDIVHDTFTEWFLCPKSFNEAYAWNRLMSRRKNWMRKVSRRRGVEESFKLHYGEQLIRDGSDDPASISMKKDMMMEVRGEILVKKLDHHVQILYAHFIDGLTVPEIKIGELSMRKKTVQRFKHMMVKKYGGG